MDIRSLFMKNTPAFTTAIEDCAPGNSSPYVIGWGEFQAVELSGRRRHLRSELLRMTIWLSQFGISSPIIMVGGSVLRESESPCPRDVDAVAFYEVKGGCRRNDITELQGKVNSMSDVDIRLIPLDLPAIDVIKIGAYFAMLYARSRHHGQSPNGVILLDMGR